MPSNEKKRRANRHQFALAVLAVFFVVGFFWYRSQALERLGSVRAHFVTQEGSQVGPFELEVVSTAAERRKGLMFRKPGELEENEGMLFIFPREEDQSFWMKNTFLSLDMVFIDSDRKVVGIVENVPPQSTESRKVGKPSIQVIELLGGVVSKRGIREGMTLKVDGVLPKGS